MERLLIATLGLLFGSLCSIQAKKKNRFTKNWFLTGFLTGPIGLTLISFLPNLNQQGKRENESLTQEDISFYTA